MSNTAKAAVAWLLACPLLSEAKFTSTFAVLDVKKGRGSLEKRMMQIAKLQQSGIPVVIFGRIQPGQAWSGDDNVSREFAIDVDHVLEVQE